MIIVEIIISTSLLVGGLIGADKFHTVVFSLMGFPFDVRHLLGLFTIVL